MDDALQNMVNQRLGKPPAAAPAPAPTAAAAAAATNAADPATAQSKGPATTPTEKATAAAEPKSGDGASGDPSVTFIKLGDREYTASQLEGSMNRYRDLNFKWQNIKPVANIVEKMMETAKAKGYDPKPDEVAKFIEDAIRLQIQTATGQPPKGEKTPKKEEPKDDDDSVFETWEKENAVKLPPGFKEQNRTVKGLSAKVDELLGLINEMVQKGGQLQQAQGQTQQQAQQTQQAAADVYKQRIDLNMQRAFSAAGLPAEAAEDFFTFAMARGYTPQDFIDPELAQAVATDYKANKDAPEVARLREIAKRRQAFTGSAEGAPGGAAAPAAPAVDPTFNTLLSRATR